jgi:predicted amidohydrolase
MAKVHAFQLDLAWEDRPANLAAARQAIAASQPERGSLIVLPEMFDVAYTMNAALATDEPHGQTRAFLAETARQYASHVIAGCVANDPAGRPANHAFAFAPDGSQVAAYRKVHPFTPAGEHLSYARGDAPVLFDWNGLKVAPLVCYDLRFPELFRAALDLGAELFVVIASWPAVRVEAWSILARARAIENLAYLVALNRVGRDPNCAYPGRSVVLGPKGEVLAEAGDQPTTLVADIDAETVRNWRRDYPALRDRVIGR